MTDIDDKIKQSLQAEDSELFAQFEGDQNLFEMVADNFQGKLKWINYLTIFFLPVVFAAGVYTAIEFFEAQSLREMIAWSVGFMICVFGVMMMKLWFWMEMNKNSIRREIKRLELQIASLAGRLNA